MELKKSPEADLNNKRGSFMVLGYVAALALILIAFEWTSYDKRNLNLGDLELDLLEDEIIPVTIQQPPPPPPPPAPATQIEIVDDEEDIEDDLEIFDLEIDENSIVEFVEMPEETAEEEQVFTVVEDPPSFPGGDAALFKFLSDNIKYPAMAKDAGVTGVVFVTFKVGKDGSVTDVAVLRGIGAGCDEEAVRVIKAMPKWTPGRQRGKEVIVQYNLPIRFTLK
ncbi:MAG: energy transducer TonB [Luteibaculaceae bacterium]